MNTFSAPAIVEKVETMSDGGCKLRVATQQLNPEAMSKLFELKGKVGYFLYSIADTINTDEIPTEPVPDMKGEKSPSARLKARMFVYYKAKHTDTSGFNLWYANALDEVGNKYLDKLED